MSTAEFHECQGPPCLTLGVFFSRCNWGVQQKKPNVCMEWYCVQLFKLKANEVFQLRFRCRSSIHLDLIGHKYVKACNHNVYHYEKALSLKCSNGHQLTHKSPPINSFRQTAVDSWIERKLLFLIAAFGCLTMLLLQEKREVAS